MFSFLISKLPLTDANKTFFGVFYLNFVINLFLIIPSKL